MATGDSLLIEVWEAAASESAVLRPAAMLAAFEKADAHAVRRLPLAERDAALLAWRRRLFGAGLAAVSHCPGCGVRLEYQLDVEAFDAALRSDRLLGALCTDDLTAAMRHADPAAWLRGRVASVADVTTAPAEGPPQLLLECAECGHAWPVAFDIGSLFWRELAAAAQRLLRDVAVLAKAFGWSEQEILALGRTRRNAYLAMVEG